MSPRRPAVPSSAPASADALRAGVESTLDLLAGAHGLLPSGAVPRAEVEALLLLVQARLEATLAAADEVAHD
jgi:hypothetical protein